MEKGRKNNNSSWFLRAFVVLGLVMTFFTFGLPYTKLFEAKRWAKVDCTILNAHAVKKTTTNSHRTSIFIKIEVLYEYTYDGRKYQGNKYGFFDKLTHTYKGASAIAAMHLTGSTVACYVNPANPSEAVLQRDFEVQNLLGLVPLIFSAAGGIGLWQRRKIKQPAGRMNEAHEGEIELKSQSRVKNAVGWFFIALVCCASAAFLWNRAPIIMSVVFGFIGILLLCLSVNMFLAIFNPRVCLKLIPAVVEVGKAGVVTWEVQGHMERLRKLTVSLECRQRKSIDGKKMATTTLYKEELAATTNLSEITKGEIGFVLGPEQQPTQGDFDENIRWYLIIKGDIKRWPDIEDEFEFRVVRS